MRRSVIRKMSVAMLASALALAGCGGSDDDASLDSGPAGDDTASEAPPSDDVAETAGTEASPIESASPEEPSAEPTDPENAPSVPSGDASSDAGSCDEIFPAAEIEAFFAEPATLTEDSDSSMGLLMCTWETIEDENDTEDLAFKLLITQLYSGDPVPASSFIDPSIFETVTTIDGVGDVAFSTEGLGTDYYFLDEPVGGSMSYTEKDLGSDAPPLRTSEDTEALFRTFHDRVT